MSLLRPTRPLSAIGFAPLAGVSIALLLAAAPLFSHVAGWAPVLLFAAAAMRLHAIRSGARLPSLAVKVVLFASAAGGIAMSYGSWVGVEPGLSILVVLVALKLLETNTERDFQVLVLLGWFLGLCDLFFSQDLSLWLYVGAIFALLTATLVRFHAGPAGGGFPRALRLAGTMLAQALPIIVLLFVLFPRSNAAFRFQFTSALMRGVPMSDQLSPGSVASLALNPEVAFRVDFPDRNAPPISEMYWRGAVMWRGDGLTWALGQRLSDGDAVWLLGGEPIVQLVTLQPHGARWIFALDRPAANTPPFQSVTGGYLQSRRPIVNRLQYRVTSQPESREARLPPDQLTSALALPITAPSPRVRALAESWRAGGKTAVEIVEQAKRYFREEGFSYSLDPGTYGENALDAFLFERRTGFCEHYAAAFATLMRLAGVPARVVIGYHGGELNHQFGGSYVIVRQSDAHAWTEVWIRGRGWQRVDPTEAIAPERISSGLASYLESRAAADQPGGGGSTTMLGWREIMRDVRLAWDSINHQWDLHVLNFDEDEQRTFLTLIGLGGAWSEVFLWQGIGVILVIGTLSLWLRRPGRVRVDDAGRYWARFCRLLATAGVRREPWEGPQRFGERAAATFPADREHILRIADLYARLRYSPTPPSATELANALRSLPRRLKSPRDLG